MNPTLLNRRNLLTLAAAGMTGVAYAQADRTLSFIVPQPAGNPTDGLARKLAPVLQRELNQTVVIDNVPGAGGSIGVNKALRMPADAPALLIGAPTETILTPLALAGVRYKPEDLRALAVTGHAPYVLVGRADLPAANLTDLIALARKQTDRPLSHGNIGPGSMIHLLGEMFGRRAGVELTQVAYKGVPPMVQDIMGGQVDLTFLPLAGSTLTLIDSGKLKAFGTAAQAPSPRLPKVLPMGQQHPAFKNFAYSTWGAVFVPKPTPDAIVQRLSAAVTKALKDPDYLAYVAAGGSEAAPSMTQAQVDRFYEDETRIHQALARDIGIKPL